MSTVLEEDAALTSRTRRSGGREARRAMRAAPLADDIRPVRAGLEGGRYKPLTENELERIHEAVLTVLETVISDAADAAGADAPARRKSSKGFAPA